MTDLRALLAPIRARLAAATPGPWEIIGGGEWINPIGITVAPDDGGVGPKDAELIANAPTDLTRLLAAIEAVVGLHCEDEQGKCAECTPAPFSAHSVKFPCPTITTLAAALGSDTTNQEGTR